VLFTCLLTASSSVSVFASDAPAEPASEGTLEYTAVAPPDDAQVREGLEEAEQREAERLQELQTPELVRQREESRTAFASLSDSAAQELLLSVFSNQIAGLNADPARYLSDVELVRSYDESAATVSDEGDGSLLEAGIPVRTEDSEGDLSKVDLSLEETETGFEPTNPLVELQIPDSADGAIELGEEGLAVSPAGVEEAEAQTLGEKNVWFPDVQEDTDMLVSPISSGVEIFDQLRSVDSPETLHFHLDLPEGAELQKNGAGGADISQGGRVIAVVDPPSAVDAQGTHVPVELEVQGESVVLHIAHREGDFAHPILVDPAIREEAENAWFFGYALENLEPSIWAYNTNDPGQSYIMHKTYCLASVLCSPSGRGLFISTMNRNIPPNTWGQFYYSVPGSTTYIPSIYPEYSAYLNPFWRNNESCSWNSYKQPHDYDGAYDVNGNWVYLEEDRAQWYGNASIFTKAKGIAFGMSTAGSWVNIPCWRDIMLGGTVIRLDDPEAPTLSSVSGVPTTWVSDATQFTITANASDPGLGVQNVTMSPEGTAVRYFTALQSQCPGTKPHPCPASVGSQLVANGTLFDEGEKGVKFSVYDPTGKTSNTISKTIKVDRTPPEVTLAGQLAIATDEDKGDTQDPEKWDPLPLPVYNLKIEAKDGVTTSGATKRSGVKSIAVYVDGKTTPEQSWEQTCAASSCPMTQTYPLKVSGLAMGKHTLEVKVKDFVGKERKRNIEFEYFPATGMKDDYVMHYFPLEDGQGDQAEDSGRPELAVNVMNGNLVYREQDIDVEGPSSVDLEVERYYNSQLPDSANTEWGDGWTLAETPQLDPEDTGGTPAPDQADFLDPTGGIENDIRLPEDTESAFDKDLQSTLTTEESGYELRDETGETAGTITFDEGGQATELRVSDYTSVDYDYKSGELSEIAVEDPGTVASTLIKYPDPPHSNPRFSSSFGVNGSGDGQLKAPGDVIQDASGNLWAVDTANNRIQKFNAKGEFLAKYGSFGAGDGQFNRPTAIAISVNGYVLVADSGNNRIQKLTPQGQFNSKFGSKGTGNGQFGGAGPEGIAIDNEGDIWVSDTYNGRLQEFSPTGTFQRVISSKGSAQGQLGEPTAIDAGPEGNLWVTDRQNNRVSSFRSQADQNLGAFVSQFGSLGSGEGQFNHPDAIDVDTKGNVWVGDRSNGRVEHFNSSGEYISEFGSPGSGQGQFSFAYPMGIASDTKGTLWITDVGNNRIQKWMLPPEVPGYGRSFGTAGSGDGQLQSPGDVAIDANGNFWVVDKANNRIEQFNSKGEYLAKFGGYGTGNGQFNRPTAIAIDPQGNLWVTDAGNNRLQKFRPSGAFIDKYGSYGSGSNQFNGPEGIAVDPYGDEIWVSDTYNGRLQRLNADGQFLGTISSKGSAAGQLGEPTGIDFDPEGNAWVADWQNNRVSVFGYRANEAGSRFLRQFGSAGSGNGQFNRPDAIDIDAAGNAWVGDQNNGRVQLFNQAGEYLAQFGTKGTGEGQFSFTYPFGIVTDDRGDIWVTDPNNNRVQEWMTSNRLRIEDDPSVDVSTSEGFVESVEGDEAGEHSYDHEGDKLISHDGPQGETHYSYDSVGRLAGIVLPDGTSALIAYNGGYGRVSSVTVDLAGETPAKTTEFTYSDEPRRTVVIPPDAPHVTYDIGEDGSVLKWWNTLQPPSIDDLSGSLYFDREKSESISIGDHNLIAQAHSEEGIASIQFIANGNVLVDEMKCDKPQVIECTTLINEWVTETGALAPGSLNLEVITTDRLGGTESKRFWVNIPYTPPPAPGALEPPKFKDIKQFREEYGLEVVFPVANELELNDRIFDLIGAWHNPQTPAGEVARASWERWGVPLRAADIAELEYREQYLAHNGPLIAAWGESNFPSTYAGYYMDHRAGGKLRVGFTSEQSARVEELKSQAGLLASDRVSAFGYVPSNSLAALNTRLREFHEKVLTRSDIRTLLTSDGISVQANAVSLAATDPGAVQSYVANTFGTGAPFMFTYDPVKPSRASGPRTREADGRLFAGDRMEGFEEEEAFECTLNIGAREAVDTKPNGSLVFQGFALEGGHCFGKNSPVLRIAKKEGKEIGIQIGKVARRAYEVPVAGLETDVEAVRLADGFTAPLWIYVSSGVQQQSGGAGPTYPGQTICVSGIYGGSACGIAGEPKVEYFDEGLPCWQVPISGLHIQEGDSGGPAWDLRTGAVVGNITGGHSITPMLPLDVPDNAAPGMLAAPGMGNLQVVHFR
jgi:tripartite motif-containing protein 71